MKKSFIAIFALLGVLVLGACNDYETYGEKKEKERDDINQFISDSSFVVISEEQFHAQGDVTREKEFVYLNNNGVYLQIVRPGCGEPIKDGEQVNLLCRFSEYNIASSTRTLQNNTDYVFDVDKMSVTRVGSTYTASFSTGLMYEVYGASVPSGWLAPLPYVKVGRPVSEGDEIAKVRIIVPHTQGHTTANSYVNPYFYDITFERER